MCRRMNVKIIVCFPRLSSQYYNIKQTEWGYLIISYLLLYELQLQNDIKKSYKPFFMTSINEWTLIDYSVSLLQSTKPCVNMIWIFPPPRSSSPLMIILSYRRSSHMVPITRTLCYHVLFQVIHLKPHPEGGILLIIPITDTETTLNTPECSTSVTDQPLQPSPLNTSTLSGNDHDMPSLRNHAP